MFTVAGLAQQEVCTPADNFGAVLDEQLENFQQAKLTRLAIDDGEHDRAKVGLHLRHLVELVQDDFRVFIALEFKHDAHAIAVALVANVRDAVNLFLVDQGGDIGNQLRLIHLERDLGDDDALAVFAKFLGKGLGAHLDRSTPAGIAIVDASAAKNQSTSREVRPGDDRQHFRQRDLGVGKHRNQAVHNLGEVMRRNVGSHADCDSRRTIEEQVGYDRGEELRFHFRVVKVGSEIDSFLVDIVHHAAGNLGQPSLGVTHRRRWIAID